MYLIIENIFNIIKRLYVKILYGPPTGRIGLRVMERYILLLIPFPDLGIYKLIKPPITLPLYIMWYY